MDPEG